MSKLTAAIIEDEVPAARLLSSIITRLRPDWEVTVLPGSVEEAIVWFRTHSHPDILFLDIQLSDGNSFDFLSAAQPSSLIIFTTAYDQYAIRAFTVNSIDYILKPVDEKRLLDAIVKYETLKGKDYKQDNYIGALVSDNHIGETLTIPPYHTLYYNATVIKREVTATYRAYFIGNNSNERIEITGKWKGTFYRNDKSIIRLEKIE